MRTFAKLAVCLCCLVLIAGRAAIGQQAERVSPTEQQMSVVFEAVHVPWRCPDVRMSEADRHWQQWLNIEDWNELVMECLAIVGPSTESLVDGFLKEKNVDHDGLVGLGDRTGLALEQIRRLYGDHLAIQRTMLRRELDMEITEREIRDLISQTQDQATVVVSVLSAEQLVNKKAGITEAQLRAYHQARRFAPYNPFKGEFGYYLGDRLVIDYIGLDVEDVVPEMDVTEEFAKGLLESEERRLELVKESYFPAIVMSRNPLDHWEEDGALLMKLVRDNEARKLITEVMTQLSERLQAPWNNAKTVRGYKVAPDQVKQPGYWDEIADWANTELKLPFTHGRSRPFPRADAHLIMPLFNKIRMNSEGVPITFPYFAFETEIRPRNHLRFPELAVAKYEPNLDTAATYKHNKKHNQYFYRIVEIRPPGATEFEEVSERVERDYRIQKAMEIARLHANDLAAEAEKVGLEAAFQQSELISAKFGGDAAPQKIGPFQEMRFLSSRLVQLTGHALAPANLGEFKSPQPVIEAAFALAREGRKGSDRRHFCQVVQLPKDRACAVVELLDHSKYAGQDEALRRKAISGLKIEKRLKAKRKFCARSQVLARAKQRQAQQSPGR